MGTPAAIQACFTHWVPVKGRSVLQLQFEIPIESQAEILTYLGAPGNPGESKWVAIALLNTGPVKAEMKGGLQAPALPPAGQAQGPKSEGERALIRCVLRCKEARFQDWVTMHALYKDGQSIADFVRARCGMVSRSEIAKNDAVMRRWLQLETKYLQDTDQMAEQRG